MTAQKRRKRRRKRRLRIGRLLLLLGGCIAIVLLTIGACFLLFPREEENTDVQPAPHSEIAWFLRRFETNRPYQINDHILDAITSEYAVIMDDTTGRIIDGKNSDQRMYPALMTKMLSAIVVIENMPDLNALIEISWSMLAGLYEANASVVGYQIGDTPTMRDILYGIALPSGADACNAAAITVAGSVDAFVAMMNNKAQQLGMTNSHFCNTTGLHEDDHYTTAEDMAVLLRYCKNNEVFAEVFSTPQYYASPVSSHPYGITMDSTGCKSTCSYGIESPGLGGAKTGFTYEAGKCLATWENVEVQVFVIITGCAGYDMYGIDHYIDHGFISSQVSVDLRRQACYQP